jgi:hypothetical protein
VRQPASADFAQEQICLARRVEASNSTIKATPGRTSAWPPLATRVYQVTKELPRELTRVAPRVRHGNCRQDDNVRLLDFSGRQFSEPGDPLEGPSRVRLLPRPAAGAAVKMFQGDS